jgi:chitinase
MNFGGTADWAIDLNRTYSNSGNGSLETDGGSDWPNYVPCPNQTIITLQELAVAVSGIGTLIDEAFHQQPMSPICLAIYTMQVLLSTLDAEYANYTDINNGYDAMFSYFVTSTHNAVDNTLEDNFMWNINVTEETITGETNGGILPKLGPGMNCKFAFFLLSSP